MKTAALTPGEIGKARGVFVLFAILNVMSFTLLSGNLVTLFALKMGAGNFLIGLLSSLVGAGGAFVSVPFMTWCNVKIHQAVATSAALGFPIALAGTLGYAWAGRQLPDMPPGALGYLYLPGLLVISLASMSTAPLGARTAHRMDIRPLKRAFAVVLYLLAAYFLLR